MDPYNFAQSINLSYAGDLVCPPDYSKERKGGRQKKDKVSKPSNSRPPGPPSQPGRVDSQPSDPFCQAQTCQYCQYCDPVRRTNLQHLYYRPCTHGLYMRYVPYGSEGHDCAQGQQAQRFAQAETSEASYQGNYQHQSYIQPQGYPTQRPYQAQGYGQSMNQYGHPSQSNQHQQANQGIYNQGNQAAGSPPSTAAGNQPHPYAPQASSQFFGPYSGEYAPPAPGLSHSSTWSTSSATGAQQDHSPPPPVPGSIPRAMTWHPVGQNQWRGPTLCGRCQNPLQS